MSGLGCKLLKKMGWTEGTGIGKSGSGIVEPIKPRLKVGTAGMGYKESERLCSGWWMEAFNKAALSASDAQVADQSAMGGSRKRRKQPESPLPVLGQPYSAFGSSVVLHDGREAPSSLVSPASPPPSSAYVATPPTDEELLAACGGRTGHAAARFGLSLGGKLARVRAQELGVASSEAANTSAQAELREERREKKRRRRQKRAEKQQLADERPEH